MGDEKLLLLSFRPPPHSHSSEPITAPKLLPLLTSTERSWLSASVFFCQYRRSSTVNSSSLSNETSPRKRILSLLATRARSFGTSTMISSKICHTPKRWFVISWRIRSSNSPFFKSESSSVSFASFLMSSK